MQNWTINNIIILQLKKRCFIGYKLLIQLLRPLTHVTRRPVEVPIPDPVHHHNLGKVAVPALITLRLFFPRVIVPRHRIHYIANLLCNYNYG